jgi:hypothetical protein
MASDPQTQRHTPHGDLELALALGVMGRVLFPVDREGRTERSGSGGRALLSGMEARMGKRDICGALPANVCPMHFGQATQPAGTKRRGSHGNEEKRRKDWPAHDAVSAGLRCVSRRRTPGQRGQAAW